MIIQHSSHSLTGRSRQRFVASEKEFGPKIGQGPKCFVRTHKYQAFLCNYEIPGKKAKTLGLNLDGDMQMSVLFSVLFTSLPGFEVAWI